MPVRTVLDTCVVIAAFEGEEAVAARAMQILEDAERLFIVSDILRLELLPMPAFTGRTEKLEFFQRFFGLAAEDVRITPERTAGALEIATRHGMSACDALHVEVARAGGADELITAERGTGPFSRVTEVRVTSIHPREDAVAESPPG